jgi:hypothetical protein
VVKFTNKKMEMRKTISEQELNSVQCHDISVQTLPNGKDLLIIMCKSVEGSNKLHEILTQNPYDLGVFLELSGNYSLVFDFIESDISLKLETHKNEVNYPPLKKLSKKEIRFITTGVWGEKSSKGRNCEYNAQLLILGQLNMDDSFKRASEVQFVPGKLGGRPSAVVLIYADYNHIFEAEADEAYNKLIELTKGNPHLEIEQNEGLVSLKIWDVLIDLEVKIDRLKYSPDQLEKFLKETRPNDSFAFVLGFAPSKGVEAAFASTKSEGLELITIKGYSHKTSLKN